MALKTGSQLGKAAIIFSVLSAILAIGIGVIGYKEEVTKLQIVGFILGITSVIFLVWE